MSPYRFTQQIRLYIGLVVAAPIIIRLLLVQRPSPRTSPLVVMMFVFGGPRFLGDGIPVSVLMMMMLIRGGCDGGRIGQNVQKQGRQQDHGPEQREGGDLPRPERCRMIVMMMMLRR